LIEKNRRQLLGAGADVGFPVGLPGPGGVLNCLPSSAGAYFARGSENNCMTTRVLTRTHHISCGQGLPRQTTLPHPPSL